MPFFCMLMLQDTGKIERYNAVPKDVHLQAEHF